jgi:hypothetical protein
VTGALLLLAAQRIGDGPSGQIGSGVRGSFREIMHFIERNPGESAFYGGLVLVFIWAVWRFGQS